MKHLISLSWVTVVMTAAAAAGCASAPRTATDAPPPDFILGLTVLTPPGTTEPAPERHIMEADWVLRSAVGAGVSVATFPPRTRQLSHEQAESLWGLMVAGGLVRDGHPANIGARPPNAPPPLRPVYVIEFTADGEHRVLAIEAGAEEDGEAARGLAERLGELAWLR